MNNFSNNIYSDEKANDYLQRIIEKNRVIMAIMNDYEIVGELIIKDIHDKKCVTISITMKNQNFEDKGYGLEAETLSINYAIKKLNVKTIYSNCLTSNTRSNHVLQKFGFKEIKGDDKFVYFEYKN